MENITASEIIDELKGHDGIHIRVIKECRYVIYYVEFTTLLFLIN